MKRTFYIVDVFAEEKYAGNQLAVIRGGRDLTDVEMQRIAKEMHFSETSFIHSETPRNSGYDVRIFTPEAEVPFAGHPTLGTAHLLRTEIIEDPVQEIILNLKAGQIPVTWGDEKETVYWMKQSEPVFGKRIDTQRVAGVLGLGVDDIDPRFPVEEVSTGLPHIIVPLTGLAALKRAKVARELYWDLIRTAWAKPILIFCGEPHQPGNDISVRMFADCFGIPEDPATGSGNGCLAGYLVRHRYWGRGEIDIHSEQGHEIGRPSLLYLRAKETAGRIDISVGGKAVTIAKGELV
jgi:trans-2,3-dihydro-3-hydroxyanthranilate isomerase